MNGEETRFKDGNKSAEKWTEEIAKEAFEIMVQNAANHKDIFSVYDCYRSAGIRGSMFHYLVDKFPVLENYKKEIQEAIAARINKGAILGDYNPTACIWRMKQLGEKDQSTQDINMSGSLNIPVAKWIESFKDED